MSQNITYGYASGDLLESRNNYFYTKFHGRGFLAAWCRQRDGALVEMSSSGRGGEHIGITLTDQLLDTIRRELSIPDLKEDGLRKLDRLLQRFEVTKRLHGEYNANWRPVDSADYHGMERYLRFAEMMELAYLSSAKLQYLNGFLKCMDTLTALAGRLDAPQKDRLEQLICQERNHIEELALRIGVTPTWSSQRIF